MKLRRNCRRKQHKPQRGTSDSGCAALFRSNFFKKALDSPTVIPYRIKASSKSLCEVAFMLKIGEFSKLSRLSVRMLRYYDASGLLTPAVVDPFTGYRYYCEEQLPTAGRIAALRDMGFPLSAIDAITQRQGDAAALAQLLEEHRRTLQARLDTTMRQLQLLRTAAEQLRKDETMMKYSVTLKSLPERYAATVRQTIPHYEDEGVLWHILAQETAPLNLIPADPCYCSVVFHDGEFKETGVDAEVQKTVRGSYPDTAHVRFRTLPPVTFASAVFRGPYHQIGDVNIAVAAWIRDNGYEYDGPSFNIYHVSPHETEDPEKYVTEVCYPVRPKQ